jgi:hypothetical protein
MPAPRHSGRNLARDASSPASRKRFGLRIGLRADRRACWTSLRRAVCAVAGKAWGCCPAVPCLERRPMSLRRWLCLYVRTDPVGLLPTSGLVPPRGSLRSVRSIEEEAGGVD